MLTTSIIAYNHNMFLKPNLGLGYPLVNLLLHKGNLDHLWRGSIHPREAENSYIDACQRTAKICQYEISSGRRVIILGGDISGLGIFSYLTKEMPQYQFECLDPLIEDNWSQTILPVKPDWDIIDFQVTTSNDKFKCVSANEVQPECITAQKIKCLYLYDVNPSNQLQVANQLLEAFK